MSHKKLFFFAIALAAAIAIAVPLIASGRNSRFSSGANLKTRNSENEAKPITEDDPQVLSFEANPSGFVPSETTVSAGKFLVLLQNRTGRRDLSFSLARENEGRVAESDQQRRDWKAQVHLNPGTYVLAEANHPEWKAIIQVAAR